MERERSEIKRLIKDNIESGRWNIVDKDVAFNVPATQSL